MKRGQIQMLADFMEGLNGAIDASSQMVHQRQNPKWMAVRDLLNVVKDNIGALVTKGMNNGAR